jgi:outer membrane protein TolC
LAQNRRILTQLCIFRHRQQLSVARHALAVLVGHAPADWSSPDFEQQLHAASAGIGIAVANEYPAITLSGALTQPIFEGGALRAQTRAATGSPHSAMRCASPATHRACSESAMRPEKPPCCN